MIIKLGRKDSIRFFLGCGLPVLGLIIFHWNKIELGHFWDEAWVYAPAIRSMATGIPTPFQNSIPLELSRAHPLLFQFLGGLWMKAFGMSNSSAHLYALCISISFVVALFLILKRFWNFKVATLAIILILVQAVFITQSCMLYPEMLMTFGLLVAVFGYSADKYSLYIIGSLVAILSKESSVVFLVAFMLADVLFLITSKIKWRQLLLHTLPLLIFAVNPIMNYFVHGFLFFPEHTSLLVQDFDMIVFQLSRVGDFLFFEQGRYALTFTIVLLILELPISSRFIKLLFLALAVMMLFVLNGFIETNFFTRQIIFNILGISLILVWIKFLRASKITNEVKLGLVLTLSIFGFTLFSAMNFFTPRYLLVCVILLCIAVSAIVWRNRWLPRWAKLVVSICLVSTSLYTTATERTVGELNLGLYDELRVNHAMTNWMENNVTRDAVFCTNFVNTYYIRDQYSGYVSLETFFYGSHENICEGCDLSEYVLITSIVKCPYDIDLESDYESVFEIRQGKSFAFIYKRKTTR